MFDYRMVHEALGQVADYSSHYHSHWGSPWQGLSQHEHQQTSHHNIGLYPPKGFAAWENVLQNETVDVFLLSQYCGYSRPFVAISKSHLWYVLMCHILIRAGGIHSMLFDGSLQCLLWWKTERSIPLTSFHWQRLPFGFRDKLGQLVVNGMEGIEIIGILTSTGLSRKPRSIWWSKTWFQP